MTNFVISNPKNRSDRAISLLLLLPLLNADQWFVVAGNMEVLNRMMNGWFCSGSPMQCFNILHALDAPLALAMDSQSDLSFSIYSH